MSQIETIATFQKPDEDYYIQVSPELIHELIASWQFAELEHKEGDVGLIIVRESWKQFLESLDIHD